VFFELAKANAGKLGHIHITPDLAFVQLAFDHDGAWGKLAIESLQNATTRLGESAARWRPWILLLFSMKFQSINAMCTCTRRRKMGPNLLVPIIINR
jgi:hypothetical protein